MSQNEGLAAQSGSAGNSNHDLTQYNRKNIRRTHTHVDSNSNNEKKIGQLSTFRLACCLRPLLCRFPRQAAQENSVTGASSPAALQELAKE